MTDALFQQQGAPYFPFKSTGDHVEGPVVNIGQVQSKKFKPPNATGPDELETWPDGKPKMTAIITVQTDMRDPEIEGDDGQRSVWIKGKSMTDATKAAVKRSGAARRGIEVGGWFSMTFTHETPNDWGGNPTKHYDVEYRPPLESAQESVNLVAPSAPTVQAPAGAQGGSQGASDASVAVAVPGLDLTSLNPEALEMLKRLTGGQQ